MIESFPSPAASDASSDDGGLGALLRRSPPANIAAEQALLGAILTNNKAYERVSDFLEPEHFADSVNGRIYEAVARRIERGQLADPVTMKAEFEHTGVLDAAGGPAYLAKLLTAMVGIVNAGDYGRVVHDAWVRRQLIDIGETVVNNAFGARPDLDGSDQIAASEEALFKLATERGQEGGFVSFGKALTGAIDVAEKAFLRTGDVVGLTSGLRDLDKRTGGLHPSDLLILAGRPAMGKTALATKIAFS
ncbi:MAG: DnaB-like helicase N-terminal domain-containing protein, partial [Gluconobacter sp.]